MYERTRASSFSIYKMQRKGVGNFKTNYSKNRLVKEDEMYDTKRNKFMRILFAGDLAVPQMLISIFKNRRPFSNNDSLNVAVDCA